MIDVVGAEGGADQLLEQIGFFIRALGRAETGERTGTVLLFDRSEPVRDQVQGFIPRSFSESRHDLGIIDDPAWPP